MNKQKAPIYELVSIQGALKTQTLKDGWIVFKPPKYCLHISKSN